MGSQRARSATLAWCWHRPQSSLHCPATQQGAFSVQDAGAQLAAPLLGVSDGMRVLDACAAPGGKTTHLAELATLDLLALDNDATRLRSRRPESRAAGLARAHHRCRRSEHRTPGGTASVSTAYSSTSLARRLESCAAIPTPSGCGARATSWASASSNDDCSMLRGHVCCRAAGCSMRRARYFVTENAEQIAAFMARHADARRLPLQLPSGFGRRRRTTLAIRGRGRAQSRRVFLRPPAERTMSPDCARPAARGTPPRPPLHRRLLLLAVSSAAAARNACAR